MNFTELNLITPILNALADEGYEEPSPIQEQAIPVLLAGKDILASAQTGTGKTAAFAIPIIQGLYLSESLNNAQKHIQVLVLAPTRELAEQIKDSFKAYGRHVRIKSEVIYGGVSQRSQELALKRGVDILVATPGRLLDLMNQKLISLDHVKYLVLDEADRMLDMGFIHDVKKITKVLPTNRQTMLFSATIQNEILKLASDLLIDPVRIEVTPPETMIDKISQSLYFVNKKEKFDLLLDLLVNPKMQSILIFTRTKHGANKLVKELLTYGVKVDAIHGNKSQSKRLSALADFKSGSIRILVATDIAARGIDIEELSHVINYDLPETAETYVHRIGRTGRAGFNGDAISFCSPDENHLLKQIEKHIKMSIPVIKNTNYHDTIKIVTETASTMNQKKAQSGTKNLKRKALPTVKNNNGEKYKKSYHELMEEKEMESSGFKRSKLPRQKPVLFVDEPEDKKTSPKKDYGPKGYEKKDLDRGEKPFRNQGPRTFDSKSPRSFDSKSPRQFSPDGKPSRPYNPDGKPQNRFGSDGKPQNRFSSDSKPGGYQGKNQTPGYKRPDGQKRSFNSNQSFKNNKSNTK